VSESSVVVHADADLLAQAAAARLTVKLLDAQAERGAASVVLTGGGIATKMYQALRGSPARDAVDWRHVDIWWGDERFLPSGDPERNEVQAGAALLDALPLDPARVHRMPSSGGPDGDDPEAAAARYADELAAAARPGTALLPHFDVVLLGIGPDGHVASVFPEHPAAYESRPVSAVRGSPKPPPNRITLTLPALNTGQEVWLIAAGAEKASAVGMALAGAGPVQLPAAGVRGIGRTLWLLDRAAAAEVGPRFRSLR
jgi:6-phosphogluconolactonase